MTPPKFCCCICNQPVGGTFLCFDRRIEKVVVETHDGRRVTACHIAFHETLLIYCSEGCWRSGQGDVASALKLRHTFPAFSFVTPCCRCGKAVNRTHHYLNYSISEVQPEGDAVEHCINDQDFAVLCTDCELPDISETESEHRAAHDEERILL